ncbi:MAG TPA: bifunctional acetate--CoA ligase family protein/GNAT family N-acetyltransferase [Woeseiaceae bacterium]|nr:bifunctional acetate--CoA ligase family protein/GNAT family N-acetyltransferase [Woeseiaceae bacterium]
MQYVRDQGPDIAPIFEARSVALIGASEREGSLGTVVLRNLVDAGFEGPIYAVNPKHDTVQGRPCYASLRDIGEPVELAVILTPAQAVPDVLDDCGAHNVSAAVILSAGFREAGEDGRALEQVVLDRARRHRIRFIGPNCLGVMRPAINLNATFSQRMAKPGQIALVSQSGAMCTAMLDWASPRNIGFSCVISSGIAADLDFGEILDYLVIDPATQAIMLYVEGIHEPRRFMSALRAASRAKPVIVMKAGRFAQGSRAAVSHTGALVGADDVFDAALNRAGVVRVHNYSDFFAVAETLHTGVRTAGPRLAVVTNGGGPGVMAADFLIDRDLVLADLSGSTCRELDEQLAECWSHDNPVDVLGDATDQQYAAAVESCLGDEGVDCVLAIVVPQAMTDPTSIAERMVELKEREKKPVLTCWMGDESMQASRNLFREHGIPTYATPEAAVEAFAAAAAYRANQELLLQVPQALGKRAEPDREGAQLIIQNALARKRRVLDLVESKALLAAFGIPVVRSIPAHDPNEALAIAEEFGFPVAMKIHSADISHKTEVDGVRLGISSGRDVQTAYRQLVETAQARRPDAKISGVLIEPMWQSRAGRELMLGVINDEVFGPVISVGLGGTMVEVLRDRAIGLPPLNRFLARSMIAGTRASRFLDEFRGRPAANRRALEDVILRLSDMVCELPWLEELDINPLVVDAEKAMALDARIVVKPVSPAAREYSHMAIHPYPSKLVDEYRLLDGTYITIRPIRPEDAETEREFVDGLSERSRYLRFMYSLKNITLQMVSRFTQIDYDREMALIALVDTDGRERQIAVGRYVMNPDGRSCEFAIVVADDWHGKGIATELLRRLIDIARDRRLEEMAGIVLRENKGMIALAKDLGFDQQRSPDDPGVVIMTLKL